MDSAARTTMLQQKGHSCQSMLCKVPSHHHCCPAGSFVCGWGFLISLTFCIQDEADGIAGTQQVGEPAADSPLCRCLCCWHFC